MGDDVVASCARRATHVINDLGPWSQLFPGFCMTRDIPAVDVNHMVLSCSEILFRYRGIFIYTEAIRMAASTPYISRSWIL